MNSFPNDEILPAREWFLFGACVLVVAGKLDRFFHELSGNVGDAYTELDRALARSC